MSLSFSSPTLTPGKFPETNPRNHADEAEAPDHCTNTHVHALLPS